jgi:hypothetical protein
LGRVPREGRTLAGCEAYRIMQQEGKS